MATPSKTSHLKPNLHTINKPAGHPPLLLAQAALNEGDSLLFLEDGVITLAKESQSAEQIAELQAAHSIYAIDADIKARGLQERLPDWVTVINYDGFVQLTETHQQTLSWF